MSKYHDATLNLLGSPPAPDPTRSLALQEWANHNRITLPAAFLEWAQLDGARILKENSNTDNFYFDQPKIVTTPDGVCGFLFHEESQGNFQMIVALDQGDDPPVLFSWLGDPPWVQYTNRFSDFVFTQVFDFEYRNRDDGFIAEFTLRSDRCIAVLRNLFVELVPSRFVIDNAEQIRAFRFMHTPRERITALVWPTGKTAIVLTGTKDLVVALENELLEKFGEDADPLEFSIVNVMANEFDRLIRLGSLAKIKYGCIERPTDLAIQRLVTCHNTMLLRQRIANIKFQEFPRAGNQCRWGEPDWGIEIIMQRKNQNWWLLQAINVI